MDNVRCRFFLGFIVLQLAAGCIKAQTIRYGSHVKIKHLASNQFLHSHDIKYKHKKSSGQQQVVAFANDDDNNWWIVKGPHGTVENHKAGETVQNGDVIRLTHLITKRNLHTHQGFPSPVTNQQEVTAFGELGVGDNQDDWRIEVEGGGPWEQDTRFQLVHVVTGMRLHSHRGFSNSFTENMQEVTAFQGQDENNGWYACAVEIPDDIIKLSRKKIRREMLKIAVVDFAERGNLEVPDAGLTVAEWFTTALQKTEAFDIYERLSLQKLQSEYNLQQTGLLDEKTMAQIGKVRGVQAIVTGSIMKFQTTISVTVKLIDTETAKIIDSADIKTKSMDAVPFEIDNLAWELATE
jgi:TolB-like protein